MKIARISNMHQPFPPADYGGAQRSMSQMTYFQAMAGHDVVLYGPSDSTIESETAVICAKYGFKSVFSDSDKKVILFEDRKQSGSVTFRTTGYPSVDYNDEDAKTRNNELVKLLIKQNEYECFDIIHCHSTSIMPFLIEAGLQYKTICQLHDLDPGAVYKKAPYPVIAISQYHANHIKREHNAQVLGVAYHGLDQFNNEPTIQHAGYLAAIGRFSKKKGLDLAVHVARETKIPMILAGTTQGGAIMEMHFHSEVKPYIDHYDPEFLMRHLSSSPEQVVMDIKRIGRETGTSHPIIFVGSANEEQKQVLYSNAQATLFPIRWEEPFGRVMIESMACGTPVIANSCFNGIYCGSVNEVIDEGLSGYKIEAENDADCIRKFSIAIEASKNIDRALVRSVFEKKWTSEANVRAIENLYQVFFEQAFLPGSSISQKNSYFQREI